MPVGRSFSCCTGTEENPVILEWENEACGEVGKLHKNAFVFSVKLECGPMPNVMADLPNISGALCSTPQSLVEAHY